MPELLFKRLYNGHTTQNSLQDLYLPLIFVSKSLHYAIKSKHISLSSNNRAREHRVSELLHTCYTHIKQSLSQHNNTPMDQDRSQQTEAQILALGNL